MFGLTAASRRFVGPLVVAAAIGLSGCTIAPLYSSTPGGVSLQSELAAISVLPATDRVTQIVRNELVFAFTGGGTPAPARYELSVSANAGGGGLNITAPGNVASTIIQVSVAYSLIEIATGQVVARGSASAETRYEQSNSEFANIRARQDAMEKAAIAAAATVRVEISGALAAR